jgi:hypothetical protein
MIEFTGDFKDLIPMGFKFHKLFANNYKVYEKNKVWIWVAHGGYVEISDHYDNSVHIAKMILDGTYPVYKEDKDYKIFTIKKGKPKPCTINRKTGEIVDTMELMRSVGGHDKWIEMVDRDDYRDVSLYRKTMETIKELAEKGMIECR